MRKTGQSVKPHSAPRSNCWRPSGNAMRHLRARRVSLSVLASFETPPSVFEPPPATPRRVCRRRCQPSRWQLLTQWTRPRTSMPSRMWPLSVAQRLGPKRNRRRSGCAKQRLPSTAWDRRAHPPATPLHPVRPLLPPAPQHAASRAWTTMTTRRRATTTRAGLRPCTSHARREARQRP